MPSTFQPSVACPASISATVLRLTILWELPFGHERRWLSGKTPLRAVWELELERRLDHASGLPFTPRILGNTLNVSQGVNGTQRADVVPGQPVTVPDPLIAEWFNTAAFVAPSGVFGDARRNSIEGPGSRLFDMSSPDFSSQ